MAETFVALLRGINVARAKRVAMADLRKLIEGLGYGDVRTLLNSGNVVFAGPRAAAKDAGAKIEKAMTAKLGVSSKITILDAAALAAIMAENPFAKQAAATPNRLLAGVLARPADRALLAPLAKQKWTPDALVVGARVAWLWCPNGQIDSPVAIAAWKALGDRVTARNWATMLKLHALAS